MCQFPGKEPERAENKAIFRIAKGAQSYYNVYVTETNSCRTPVLLPLYLRLGF